MPGRFPDAWLDELYARLDIVQVVSAYVPLKKNGNRYWGLCPFHHEKTASFSVNPEHNLFYCFGCKAGGNVIQFVEQIENLSFVQAAETLAERVGLPVPQVMEDPDYEKRKSKRDRLFEINREAARFYHGFLWTNKGRAVLDYFYRRGLNDSVIRKFGLGAAPDGWDEVLKYLTGKGYARQEIVEAGLAVQNDKGAFDMFRNRALFPIINSDGMILGFGGRALENIQPKYLNTGDTPVFNKRLGVYAINLVRKARNLKRIILVEGYMDVVSLVQFGVEGVVATLGTSLTKEQARLLKRYAPEVWVAYDGDAAGQHAILRALDIFESESVPCRVLFFPDGLDPDEFIRQRGKEAFEQIRPLAQTQYRLETERAKYDLSTEDGRMGYAKAAAGILRKLREPVERDRYLKEVSRETGYEKEVLAQQIGLQLQADAAERPSGYRRTQRFFGKNDGRQKELEKTERMLLSLVSGGKVPEGLVTESDFMHETEQTIFHLLMEGHPPSAIMMHSQDPEFKTACAEVFFEQPGTQNEEEILGRVRECLKALRIYRYEQLLSEKRKACETEQSPEQKARYLQDIVLLSKELTLLKQKS